MTLSRSCLTHSVLNRLDDLLLCDGSTASWQCDSRFVKPCQRHFPGIRCMHDLCTDCALFCWYVFCSIEHSSKHLPIISLHAVFRHQLMTVLFQQSSHSSQPSRLLDISSRKQRRRSLKLRVLPTLRLSLPKHRLLRKKRRMISHLPRTLNLRNTLAPRT